MNTLIVFCAQYLIYPSLLAAFIYWLTIAHRKLIVAVYGVITGIIALALAEISKHFIKDPRPFMSSHVTALFHHAPGNGFPSDHTLLMATVAVALFTVSKKWGIGFMALAIIIGGARVLAHVHHWLDIGGAIVFALIGYAIALWLAPKIMKLFENRQGQNAQKAEK